MTEIIGEKYAHFVSKESFCLSVLYDFHAYLDWLGNYIFTRFLFS